MKSTSLHFQNNDYPFAIFTSFSYLMLSMKIIEYRHSVFIEIYLLRLSVFDSMRIHRNEKIKLLTYYLIEWEEVSK
jgi:hypothetical protein